MLRKFTRLLRTHLPLGLLTLVLGAADPGIAAAQAPAGAPQKLVIGSFGGSLDVGYKAAFKKFEQDNNVTVQWVPGSATDNLARTLASQSAPQYDLVFVEDVTYLNGLNKGLWATIDPKIVTNYADLYPQARPPKDGGVPVGLLSEGIIYRPDEFAKRGWPAPQHWIDLLDPIYCGYEGISHPNLSDGLRSILMMAGGDPDKVPGVLEKMAGMKKCIPVLETAAPQLEEKIRLGQYLIASQNSIHAIPLINKGFPMKYIVPKEGTVAAYSIAALVKGGPNPAMAQKAANWFISPESQHLFMTDLAYAPTNQKVSVPKELADTGILDAEGMKHIVPVDSEKVAGLIRGWSRTIDRDWAK